MTRIDKCFIVNGGILVIVEPLEGNTLNMKKISAQLGAEEDGLVLFLEECAIPLPEDLFDYITENRVVTIYQVDGTHYANTPTASIELQKDMLIEAKAIYRYHKGRIGENRTVEPVRVPTYTTG